MPGRGQLLPMLFCALLFCSCSVMRPQGVQVPGDPCKPVSQRTKEVGCWILADDPVGQFSSAEVFWHLDAYATRAAAQADKSPQGIVVESLGKTFLMTIAPENWKAAHGTRVGAVGPIPVNLGESYSAQLMEANFLPGMIAPEHMHSGPEAWFTTAGQACLESSDGRMQVSRAGGPSVVVPAGLAMHLTAIGTQERRSIVLILHDSSKPPTVMVHDWKAKGLCKAAN